MLLAQASPAASAVGEPSAALRPSSDAGETSTTTTILVVSDPDNGEGTASDVDGSDAATKDAANARDGFVTRETSAPSPRLGPLGTGAVFLAIVLGLTVVLRRGDSSQERL